MKITFYEYFGWILCAISWAFVALAFLIEECRNKGVLSLALIILLAGCILVVGSIYRNDKQ